MRSGITIKIQTYIWFRELVLPGFSCNVCSLQYFYAFQARSAVRQRSLGTQGSNPKKAQKAQDLCFLVWWFSHFLLFCRYLRIHVDLETVNLSCQEAPVVGRVVGGFILWSIPTLGDSIYVSFTYIVCFAYLITCKRATVNILASTAALEGLQYKLGSQV